MHECVSKIDAAVLRSQMLTTSPLLHTALMRSSASCTPHYKGSDTPTWDFLLVYGSNFGPMSFLMPQTSLSLSVLMAIFQVNSGKPVFIEAKDDGSGGNNWSYKSYKALVKSSSPTNQHPVFLQAGCPSCCPANSVKALKGKYHIPWTCLPQAHLGVFQLCV